MPHRRRSDTCATTGLPQRPLPPCRAPGSGRAGLDAASAARKVRWARRCCEPPPSARFDSGVKLLTDGTELHLAYLQFVYTSLNMQGVDHPAFAALYLLMFWVGRRGACHRTAALSSFWKPLPRTRPLKRLSGGEVAELRRQLIDLLDRLWIQPSTAGHAGSVVIARKPDGTWRISYDYRGLNVITEPLVVPLPHIDALLDETRGAQ